MRFCTKHQVDEIFLQDTQKEFTDTIRQPKFPSKCRNCKNDDVCNHLNSLFLCEKGLCQNISTVYDCVFEKVISIPVDCHDKRNCLNLQGLYDCKDGICHRVNSLILMTEIVLVDFKNSDLHYFTYKVKTAFNFIDLISKIPQVEWPWHCERRCQLLPTDTSRNVVILAGDRMVAASCETASNLVTGVHVWKKENHVEEILVIAKFQSCWVLIL